MSIESCLLSKVLTMVLVYVNIIYVIMSNFYDNYCDNCSGFHKPYLCKPYLYEYEKYEECLFNERQELFNKRLEKFKDDLWNEIYQELPRKSFKKFKEDLNLK